jgi:predicted GH43/DUF377 family glycosyl hydrolase
MRTHAANPVAEPCGADLFRIYFSCRDERNRSSIGWVEVDLRRPKEIIRVSDAPVIGPGRIGTFDDSGTSMGWLVRRGSQRYLYYLGWNLGVTVPWRNSIGLAISADPEGEFVRQSEAPVMDRSREDPFSISYPCVLIERERWHMWYGSNLGWGPEQTDMVHVLKHAESADGVHWVRDGGVAVGFNADNEYAMSKPCVIHEGGRYRMWYSFRGAAYRIGYAESEDGRNWVRHDERVGLTVSDSGWDSETVEYPFVFDHAGRRYMLYNGNGYGLTGLGIAELESE